MDSTFTRIFATFGDPAADAEKDLQRPLETPGNRAFAESRRERKRALENKRERAGRNPGNGRKTGPLAGISQVLGNVLDQAGLAHLAYEEKLRRRWTELLGPRAAAIASLESLKGWTLRVRVESATWRQELHFQKETLRKRANEILGAELVKDIQLL